MTCVKLYGSLDKCLDSNFNYPDHILFRGNDQFQLSAKLLKHISEFEGSSDHKAMMAVIDWERLY